MNRAKCGCPCRYFDAYRNTSAPIPEIKSEKVRLNPSIRKDSEIPRLGTQGQT